MELNRVYPKVFAWMFIGLLLTFLTGYTISQNTEMLRFFFQGYNFLIFVIIEVILVIVLAHRVTKMSPIAAKILFCVYSIINGITFASIFIVYKLDSIIYVFGITALLFGLFAVIGKLTNLNLRKIGTFLLMALIGIIICSIINMFIGSEGFDLVLTILSIIIFLGYTAYDIKLIEEMSYHVQNEDNLAIFGALQLYLDFVNLFIELIKLFGKRND